MIAPGAQFRYLFTPQPAGFRWYHTHTFAGHDLKRGTYTGQFGCFYIEPKNDPGAYDQEIFLTLHDWNAYMAASGDSSMEAAYEYATIDGRMLGFGDPLRVREGQRVLLHHSECERQHGSLAGARGARNDRGRHGWQSGAHARPGARSPFGSRRAHRCRRHDESAGSVDSWGDARPIAQDGHGNRGRVRQPAGQAEMDRAAGNAVGLPALRCGPGGHPRTG